jgi:hypothetical protein
MLLYKAFIRKDSVEKHSRRVAIPVVGIAPPRSHLQMYLFALLERPKAALVINKDDGLILNVYFHVEQTITVYVFETECYGG